jgi:Phage tail assembly chaperone protein
MQVRIKSTGQVMYEAEFRAYTKANGGPSWETTTTEVLETLGADVVLEGPQATGGTVYQYSQASGVEQIDGKWYTKHILGPVFTDGETTAAEQEVAYKASKDAEQAKSVRATRGEKLADSDWTQVADSPVDKAVWATYRQALRDVTAQSGFPWTITWPDAP